MFGARTAGFVHWGGTCTCRQSEVSHWRPLREQLSHRTLLLQSWGAGCLNAEAAAKAFLVIFVCIQPRKEFLCFLALRMVFK